MIFLLQISKLLKPFHKFAFTFIPPFHFPISYDIILNLHILFLVKLQVIELPASSCSVESLLPFLVLFDEEAFALVLNHLSVRANWPHSILQTVGFDLEFECIISLRVTLRVETSLHPAWEDASLFQTESKSL